jgi:hypothetical protein
MSPNVSRAVGVEHTHVIRNLALQGRTKSASTSKNEVVAAKAHLSDQLPISEYHGQVVLAPGKFTSAELVELDHDMFVYDLFYKASDAQ